MIKTLIGVRLSALVSAFGGGNAQKKSSLGRAILFGVLYAYVAVVFVGFSVLMAITLGGALVPIGAGKLYMALFATVAFAVLFVMSIFETKSELFDCKDNELILSMPIKPRDIVVSRILTILIYNYVGALVVMLPATITYTVISGDAVGCIGAVLSILIIPLPATALAGVFGYVLALISKRTRYSNLITVLFSLAFVAVYFAVYSKILVIGEDFFENAAGGIEFLGGAVSVLGVIGGAVLLSPIEFSVFAAVSLTVSAVAFLVLAKNYLKIVTDTRGAARVEYKEKEMVRTGALLAILKKEFAKILSSSVYLLNAGLGTVFRVAIGVFAIVKSSEITSVLDMLMLEFPDASIDGIKALGVCIVILFMSSMDMFSASSVSLEGKSFWIIKSMPVKPYTVLMAKTAAHVLICATASVLSAALMLIAVRASVLCWLIAIPFAIISAVELAIFGTVINVALPKFEFENEAQPVKQSLACFVVLFGQMLFGALNAYLSYLGAFSIGGYLTALAVLGLNGVICVALYFVMSRVSVRIFAKI